MSEDIPFNNGFITAIALFLEHKNQWQELRQQGISDMRLYASTDHLYNLEIPKGFDKKITARIKAWRGECFSLRLANLKDYSVADALFKEAEDILVMIDEKIFKTKKVELTHR